MGFDCPEMDYFDERDCLKGLADTGLLQDDSEIENFYSGQEIFITGSTGLIGQLIVEKILRCIPSVKKIHLLIRQKKDKTAKERADNMFEGPVFVKMRQVCPNFMEKVEIIPGNLEDSDLGLSVNYQEQLKTVNIVIHGAADLGFDKHIKMSYKCNVLATRDLLELTKQMCALKSFIYISTTYTRQNERRLKEDFYEYNLSFQEMSLLLDSLSDSQATAITPLLIQGFASVYSLSKLMTENLILEYMNMLPIGIIRPSIVLNTNSEPITAWLNSVQITTALIIGSALGFWRVHYWKKLRPIHAIPADKVANSVIAVAWEVSKSDCCNPPVYHSVPDKNQVPTFIKLFDVIENGFFKDDLASEKQMWAYVRINIRNKRIYWMLTMLLQILPGILVDIILRIKGNKPLIMKLHRKVASLDSFFDQYVSRTYCFDDEKLRKVWSKMKDVDKQKFDFNMIGFDWSQYGRSILKGIKVYLVKESMDDLPVARARLRRLEKLHFILCKTFQVSIALTVYKVLLPTFQHYLID